MSKGIGILQGAFIETIIQMDGAENIKNEIKDNQRADIKDRPDDVKRGKSTF